MKISIIIPSFNDLEGIDRCVESILNQTEKDLEFIFIDDKSTDGSGRKLDDWAQRDERIVVLHNEKNSGTLVSRKRGVLAARGEFIMFSDSDDWYDTNACAELYEEITKADVDVLIYGARAVSRDENGVWVESNVEKLKVKEETLTDHRCLFTQNEVDFLWNKIVRRDVCVKAYKNAEELYCTMGEDTYACLLMFYYAESLKAICKAYYNWSIESGVSSNAKMSLASFDRFCKSRTNYATMVNSFLVNAEHPERIPERLAGERKAWPYNIDVWSRRLADEDLLEGYRILEKYHDGDELILSLCQKLRDKDKLKSKYKTLQAESKAQKRRIKALSESGSMKIGKLITWLPRKFRKKH